MPANAQCLVLVTPTLILLVVPNRPLANLLQCRAIPLRLDPRGFVLLLSFSQTLLLGAGVSRANEIARWSDVLGRDQRWQHVFVWLAASHSYT